MKNKWLSGRTRTEYQERDKEHRAIDLVKLYEGVAAASSPCLNFIHRCELIRPRIDSGWV